mmetsp:Transcript_37337/g.87857  ORF Transcript_37337/g.87857 Transcript_37337/m.87857 type:complete len:205 (-) Transcript_37337:262-876(-)
MGMRHAMSTAWPVCLSIASASRMHPNGDATSESSWKLYARRNPMSTPAYLLASNSCVRFPPGPPTACSVGHARSKKSGRSLCRTVARRSAQHSCGISFTPADVVPTARRQRSTNRPSSVVLYMIAWSSVHTDTSDSHGLLKGSSFMGPRMSLPWCVHRTQSPMSIEWKRALSRLWALGSVSRIGVFIASSSRCMPCAPLASNTP